MFEADAVMNGRCDKLANKSVSGREAGVSIALNQYAKSRLNVTNQHYTIIIEKRDIFVFCMGLTGRRAVEAK